MRIEKELNYYVIVKGKKRNSYFCFLVDDNSSCWTSKHPWTALRFLDIERAEATLKELQRRQRLRLRSGQ